VSFLDCPLLNMMIFSKLCIRESLPTYKREQVKDIVYVKNKK
jgi:hypothetical protein